MPNIERFNQPTAAPALRRTGGVEQRLPRQTARALANIERQTFLRVAAVQAEGMVSTAKIRELDTLAREGLTGHLMLTKLAETLSAGDPFAADAASFFLSLHRMGVGEVIADTVDVYCREARR